MGTLSITQVVATGNNYVWQEKQMGKVSVIKTQKHKNGPPELVLRPLKGHCMAAAGTFEFGVLQSWHPDFQGGATSKLVLVSVCYSISICL